MKIIIIRGTINSGKTTTSGLIYSELLQFANKQHTFNNKQVESNSLKFNNEGATVDFQAVLIVGKLKIGIVSAGDIAKNLDFDIQQMIKLKIDILVCCARSINKKGSAYHMILDNYSSDHEIVKEVWSLFSSQREQMDIIKINIVNEVIGLIRV